MCTSRWTYPRTIYSRCWSHGKLKKHEHEKAPHIKAPLKCNFLTDPTSDVLILCSLPAEVSSLNSDPLVTCWYSRYPRLDQIKKFYASIYSLTVGISKKEVFTCLFSFRTVSSPAWTCAPCTKTECSLQQPRFNSYKGPLQHIDSLPLPLSSCYYPIKAKCLKNITNQSNYCLCTPLNLQFLRVCLPNHTVCNWRI